ncbi:hypothetical protein ACLBXB_09380 [Methylobacterium mesophilicum]
MDADRDPTSPSYSIELSAPSRDFCWGPIIVDTTVGVIDRHVVEAKVLIHCNQGIS